MRDTVSQVAIAGVGGTDYGRDLGRSRGALAVDACVRALDDAGLTAADVDGLCGDPTQASPHYVQESLGIPEITWWSTPPIPFSLLLMDAVNAVAAGACTTVLAYQAQFRTAAVSRSAAKLGYLRTIPPPSRTADWFAHEQFYRPYGGRPPGYAGYMRRYQHEYGIGREHFGAVAVNSRSGARANPRAALRDPLTIEQYLAAPMVRDPMCLLDVDYAVDGGDAVVVTTAERARDLARRPVYVDAITHGQTERPGPDGYRDLHDTGQRVAAATLWSRTDVGLDDVDVVFPYDGFTIITLRWLESFGFCGPGEAGPFLAEHWDRASDRALIGGRVPVNPHGGSLSEGATQGAGHVREAVRQLRGEAGVYQVPGAEVALLGLGGLFMNATALTLRA